MLAHAELEAYFEERARDRVDRAHSRWKSGSYCTSLVSNLLVYHAARSSKGEGWDPKTPTPPSVKKAIAFYVGELGSNNGIKERNILGILTPLGLPHRRLTPTFMATLDSFGESRGKMAHLSIQAHQSIDPKSIWDDVWKNILPFVKQLDREISKLI